MSIFLTGSILTVSAVFLIAMYIWLSNRQGCVPLRLVLHKPLHVKSEADEIKILWLGDAGSGADEQRQVALAGSRICEELGCDLAFFLGDNFIQDGVSGVDDRQFKYKFEDVYPQDIPFYAILGNHDLKGDWRAQIRYTNHSDRWMMPDVNYQFNAGPVFIQAINSTCTLRSLWTIFKSSRKPWRILCCHRPYITNGRHPGMIGPERFLVEKSGVHMVFSGHNAGLEHLCHKEIDQVVSGGGGTKLPKFVEQSSPFKRFHAHTLGFVWTQFTAKSATVIFFNQDGKELYRFDRQA